MSRGIRIAVLCLLAGLAVLAGWRMVAHGVADSLAEDAPERALGWVAGHPGAQLSIAQRQAEAGDPAFTTTARALLEREPMQGDAWRLLGEAAEAEGDLDRAREYYAKALEVTPRNGTARIWMAQRLLKDGDYPGAIGQLDKLMRIFITDRPQVFDYLAQLAADPDFRDSLVDALAVRPDWREGFLRYLQQQGDAGVADAVHGDLQAKGALSSQEFVQWTESLLRRGDWNQAYARWADSLPPGSRLTPVFNGDFARRPSGRGFDWRTPASAGVSVEFPKSGGARIEYRNRRIDHGGLEQALLLAPGRYRLDARMEVDELRSDRGLEWVVECARNGEVLGRAPVDGRRGPGEVGGEIEVPVDCPGQWLRLRNAARVPALQALSGRLAVSEVSIGPSRRAEAASGREPTTAKP